MINFIKQKWFKVKAKGNSNLIHQCMGVSDTRINFLTEEISILFGQCERASQVVEKASALCSNNAELICTGMMVEAVVEGMKRARDEQRKRLEFIKNNQRSVRVHQIESSDVLHISLGITYERSLEIIELVDNELRVDGRSFTQAMEKISINLVHPNELVLACSCVQLIYNG